ncbi:response regulator transcription factor [uncultured Clostridium sp.]|uniref:response regulator transcription factor n=1 Tax=uncultured Clostridium sp. TaxID=59620 RepID=UPI0026204659|nr:response regulator transcription factor [uncultured Clostridium sp.]
MSILIVDDEIKIVEVLEAYLNKDNFKVLKANNGIDALKLFEENKVSLILLDLMLPDMSGVEVCKKIREESDVPIIMVSAKNEAEDRLAGFEVGADDYIAKPFCAKEVVARVKAVLKRTEKCSDKDIYSFDNEELIIKANSHEVLLKNEPVILTATEYKILLNLAKNPKRVYSREQLLLLALGDENDSYDRVIDTHVKNLRGKIEEDSKKPKYIVTVYGVGYRFEGKKD